MKEKRKAVMVLGLMWTSSHRPPSFLQKAFSILRQSKYDGMVDSYINPNTLEVRNKAHAIFDSIIGEKPYNWKVSKLWEEAQIVETSPDIISEMFEIEKVLMAADKLG